MWEKLPDVVEKCIVKSQRWFSRVTNQTTGSERPFWMRVHINLLSWYRKSLFWDINTFVVSKSSAHWEITVSGCFNFHSSSTNSISYESWHLQLKFETSVRSLKCIVWPQKVSEVTEVKMKKILDENPKITNFCVTEMLYTSKESL